MTSEIKKYINQEIRKCYGAYENMQNQMHCITGTITEIRRLMESLHSCFNDLNKVISEVLKIEP